jgi:Domain of unknown function (DUF4394)
MRLRTLSALAFAATMLAVPAVAHADRALMLTPGNQMVSFDTAAPATTLGTIGVTGVPSEETLRGIDFRPATGQLYGWSAVTPGPGPIRTYTIDPSSGAATLVGQTVANIASNVPGGLSFDAGIDRARYVDTQDKNARLRPADGTATVGDSPISPSSLEPDLVGLAYDRSFAGATLTTAFAIDRTGSRLDFLGGVDGFPPPTLGQVTPIGPLGFSLKAVDGGFDISADGRAFGVLTDSADGLTRLYAISLTTGGATPIGPVGTGGQEAFSLALIPGTEALPDRKAPAGLIDIPPKAKSAKLRASKVKFKFSASEACTAAAALVVGKTTVAEGAATLSGAGVAQITLKATKAGKKKLKGLKRAGGKLTLSLTDPAGNVGSVTQKLALR